MQNVDSIFGLNPHRKSDWDQIAEQFERMRVICNSVSRITGAGDCTVEHTPNGVVIGVGVLAGPAGTAAPSSGTASVIVDWRIDSSLQFQVDERVITGVTIGTAENWITKATGGTCTA